MRALTIPSTYFFALSGSGFACSSQLFLSQCFSILLGITPSGECSHKAWRRQQGMAVYAPCSFVISQQILYVQFVSYSLIPCPKSCNIHLQLHEIKPSLQPKRKNSKQKRKTQNPPCLYLRATRTAHDALRRFMVKF